METAIYQGRTYRLEFVRNMSEAAGGGRYFLMHGKKAIYGVTETTRKGQFFIQASGGRIMPNWLLEQDGKLIEAVTK